MKTFWYRRFRAVAYSNAIGFMLWTVAMVLPFAPFSYLPPIMAGGGPGLWLALGYLLYAIVGIGGVACVSLFLFMIETYEKRTLNRTMMLVGPVLLDVGLVVGCLLLGVAGAFGGYAVSIEHVNVQPAQNILLPYVNPIILSSLAAVVGTGILIYAMWAART